MQINWTPFEPHRGPPGEWAKFVGLGQTRAEFGLILIPPAMAALALAEYARCQEITWSLMKYIVVMLLAFELTGFVITNH